MGPGFEGKDYMSPQPDLRDPINEELIRPHLGPKPVVHIPYFLAHGQSDSIEKITISSVSGF